MQYISEKIAIILLVVIALTLTFKIYKTYILLEKKKEHNEKLKKKYTLAKKIQNEMTNKLNEDDF